MKIEKKKQIYGFCEFLLIFFFAIFSNFSKVSIIVRYEKLFKRLKFINIFFEFFISTNLKIKLLITLIKTSNYLSFISHYIGNLPPLS